MIHQARGLRNCQCFERREMRPALLLVLLELGKWIGTYARLCVHQLISNVIVFTTSVHCERPRSARVKRLRKNPGVSGTGMGTSYSYRIDLAPKCTGDRGSCVQPDWDAVLSAETEVKGFLCT